jgi:hypothetical protein
VPRHGWIYIHTYTCINTYTHVLKTTTNIRTSSIQNHPHWQLLQCHVMDNLIISSLHESRVYCCKWFESLHSHALRSYNSLLLYSYFEYIHIYIYIYVYIYIYKYLYIYTYMCLYRCIYIKYKFILVKTETNYLLRMSLRVVRRFPHRTYV